MSLSSTDSAPCHLHYMEMEVPEFVFFKALCGPWKTEKRYRAYRSIGSHISSPCIFLLYKFDEPSSICLSPCRICVVIKHRRLPRVVLKCACRGPGTRGIVNHKYIFLKPKRNRLKNRKRVHIHNAKKSY